jgi:ATP-dependent DNA ligase
VHLMTRKGKEFPHLEHLREQIAALHLPTNLVLDGEVYSDNLTFQEVTGLVRRETLKPARDEEVPTNDGQFDPQTGKPMMEIVHIISDEDKMKQIDYRVYDAIVLDEPAMSFINRFAKLSSYFPEGVVRHGNLVLTENFPLRGPEDLSTLHHQFTQDEDYEGVMIRNLHGTYDLNKRSKHLQKFKTFQDAEYRIIGFDEASGDDEGTVVWIVETPAGQDFRVRPEGSREQRREWFENGADYIGKMLTVKFFELTDGGIPRFPVGVAIRDYE